MIDWFFKSILVLNKILGVIHFSAHYAASTIVIRKEQSFNAYRICPCTSFFSFQVHSFKYIFTYTKSFSSIFLLKYSLWEICLENPINLPTFSVWFRMIVLQSVKLSLTKFCFFEKRSHYNYIWFKTAKWNHKTRPWFR